MKESRSKSGMGGGKKKSGKAHHVSIHHAKGGKGYIMKHHQSAEESPDAEMSSAPDMAALQQQLQGAMAQPGAAPAQAAPAGPPAGAPPPGM